MLKTCAHPYTAKGRQVRICDAWESGSMGEMAKSNRALPVTLAFTAGYADTCGFVALFSLFTAHVTGNFVLLGASLIRPHAGVIAKLLALPVFMAAVAG